jgi:hypothetical protein
MIKSVFVKARAVEKCGAEPSRLVAYNEEGENLIHTALDGKVLRGTQKHAEENQPKVHLLALYEPDTGIVIAQEDVKDKENETSDYRVRKRKDNKCRCNAYTKELVCKCRRIRRIFFTDCKRQPKRCKTRLRGFLCR